MSKNDADSRTPKPTRVTKDLLRTFAREHDVANVEKESFQPVYNPKDAELTYALFLAAITITKSVGQATVMRKHTEAALKAYNELADNLSASVPKVTKKGLREYAVSVDGVEKVSPKAIDAVYDRTDPVVTMAKWKMAVELAANKSLKVTKTVMPSHSETALTLFDVLKDVLDIAENDAMDVET